MNSSKKGHFPSMCFLSPSRKVIQAYSSILSNRNNDTQKLGTVIPIPKFDFNLVNALCDETIEILRLGIPLITIDSHTTIAGDIHGNLFDLIRLFKVTDFSNNGHLLFLGDYVDRGKFSIETVVLLFSLQCTYPDQIHLLRGNHEFSSVNSKSSFYNDIIEQYGSERLWKKINSVFEYLPISALIQKKVFCVHGGISSYLDIISDINSIKLPISEFAFNKILEDFMWSDPSKKVDFYETSPRGNGHLFGHKAISDFLKTNNINHIIRAHQVVKSGVEKFSGNRLFTVFSSSNYMNKGNKGGLIVVNEQCVISALVLPPINIPQTLKFEVYDETKLPNLISHKTASG